MSVIGNWRSLGRVALAAALTLSVGAALWFVAPVQAVNVTPQDWESGARYGYAEEPDPEPLLPTETELVTGYTGVTVFDAVAESEDGDIVLEIPRGTSAIVNNQLVDRVSIEPVAEVSAEAAAAVVVLPEADEGEGVVIGLPVDLGPDGAVFEPPITLRFAYDAALIPEGADEDDLRVAWWDADAGEWVVLEGATVDPVSGMISVPVSHFTEFIVITVVPPADDTAAAEAAAAEAAAAEAAAAEAAAAEAAAAEAAAAEAAAAKATAKEEGLGDSVIGLIIGGAIGLQLVLGYFFWWRKRELYYGDVD